MVYDKHKKEYSKKYREDNKEKIKEWQKEYYQENKEKLKLQSRINGKEYRKNNREKLRVKNKKYRAKDKEKWRKHSKKYRENNRDKADKASKKYRKRHPERYSAKQKVFYAIKMGRLIKDQCKFKDSTCYGVVQGHHPDYSKPLEVIWVCTNHHARIHSGEIKLNNK